MTRVATKFALDIVGKHEKTIPKYTALRESLAELVTNSISINSGYTSILKEVPGSNLMDQVTRSAL